MHALTPYYNAPLLPLQARFPSTARSPARPLPASSSTRRQGWSPTSGGGTESRAARSPLTTSTPWRCVPIVYPAPPLAHLPQHGTQDWARSQHGTLECTWVHRLLFFPLSLRLPFLRGVAVVGLRLSVVACPETHAHAHVWALSHPPPTPHSPTFVVQIIGALERYFPDYMTEETLAVPIPQGVVST